MKISLRCFGELAAARSAEYGSVAKGQEEGQPKGRQQQIGDTAVSIKDFTHQDVTVSVGTVVKWQNEDGVGHTATAGTPGEPSGLWDSGRIEAGTSFTLTLDEPGEYQYFCSIHIFMTATVTVTE